MMPSKYAVIFDSRAEKEFRALSAGQQKALVTKLRLLATEPCPSGSIELEGFAPLRRIKGGDARAVYGPPDRRGRIYIYSVGADHSICDDLDELHLSE